MHWGNHDRAGNNQAAMDGVDADCGHHDVRAANSTDTGFKAIAGRTQLQSLFLNNTAITRAGLRDLAGLSQLQRIAFNGTKLTDAGLRELAALTQLRPLVLYDTSIGDAG